MTVARRIFRSFLQAATLAAVCTAAAYGQGAVRLFPGFPTPSDDVDLAVFPMSGGPPCYLWSFAGRAGHTITLSGSPVPPSSCNAPFPPILVGHLEAGRYRVVAHVAGNSDTYAELRFDVRSQPETPPHWFDVSLSTPAPRAGVPFALVFSPTQNVCDNVDFSKPPIVDGDRIVLDGDLGYCAILPPEGNAMTGWRHTLPGLSAGTKTIEIRDLGTLVTTFPFHVDEDTTLFAAAGGRFEITLRWTDRTGAAHDAKAVRLAETSGQFWFFDPSNPEVTVKLVDGTASNGHWWVFASSLTSLGFTLTVHDTTCSTAGCVPLRTYTQEARHNRNFIDTSAFPACTGTCPP